MGYMKPFIRFPNARELQAIYKNEDMHVGNVYGSLVRTKYPVRLDVYMEAAGKSFPFRVFLVYLHRQIAERIDKTSKRRWVAD